jgi:hypothetical protein
MLGEFDDRKMGLRSKKGWPLKKKRRTCGVGSSLWLILVRVDLTRHDHHPHEKHTADDPEGEFGLPALTCYID